ncbi:MAG: HD domain-containing protein [Chloroflexi bacterium]|nr:HD domain-containing protein [Chloroflexota bacterium]
MSPFGLDDGVLDFYHGKRLRDQIHADVHLSPLEIKVIDTPDFQRLSGLKQLGTAYLLYRGARHTRFEHAVGTVAMTQQLVDLVNRAAQTPDGKIPNDALVIARLCALLHDIGTVPFGHTLEDESGVVTTRHDSPERLSRFIGLGTDIGKLLGDELRRHVIDVLTATSDGEAGVEKAKEVQGKEAGVKKAKEVQRKRVSELQYPYVADLVCNTICADLLDYIQRDVRNTGIVAGYDPRFLEYFTIAPYGKDAKTSKRLVLRLWRRKDLGFRQDVVSDVIHLLRLRYSLAEKVYYHPNKMVTSAMLSKAVFCSGIDEDNLTRMNDETLMSKLLGMGVESDVNKKTAFSLADSIVNRRLFKPLYCVSAVRADEKEPKWERISKLAGKYHASPIARDEKEAKLGKMASIPTSDKGKVIIYCPDLKMQLKPARVLVQLPNGDISVLEDLQSPGIIQEVERIKQQHRELWRFHVSEACVQEFELLNENSEFIPKGLRPFEKRVLDYCLLKQATLPEYSQLIQLSSKMPKEPSFWEDPEKELDSLLADIRKPAGQQAQPQKMA